MRPNSQAPKHRSSHDTEREFGGALGKSQQSVLSRRHLHGATFILYVVFLHNHDHQTV